jgi:hypothetical protein
MLRMAAKSGAACRSRGRRSLGMALMEDELRVSSSSFDARTRISLVAARAQRALVA